MMSREVGLPLARALAAFGRQDYAATVELLTPIRANAHRFGGSHAQRDVLHLTLLEAAFAAAAAMRWPGRWPLSAPSSSARARSTGG